MAAETMLFVTNCLFLILSTGIVALFLILIHKSYSQSRIRENNVWKEAWKRAAVMAQIAHKERKEIHKTLTQQEGWIASLGQEVIKRSKISTQALDTFAKKVAQGAIEQIHCAAEKALKDK